MRGKKGGEATTRACYTPSLRSGPKTPLNASDHKNTVLILRRRLAKGSLAYFFPTCRIGPQCRSAALASRRFCLASRAAIEVSHTLTAVSGLPERPVRHVRANRTSCTSFRDPSDPGVRTESRASPGSRKEGPSNRKRIQSGPARVESACSTKKNGLPASRSLPAVHQSRRGSDVTFCSSRTAGQARHDIVDRDVARWRWLHGRQRRISFTSSCGGSERQGGRHFAMSLIWFEANLHFFCGRANVTMLIIEPHLLYDSCRV